MKEIILVKFFYLQIEYMLIVEILKDLNKKRWKKERKQIFLHIPPPHGGGETLVNILMNGL